MLGQKADPASAQEWFTAKATSTVRLHPGGHFLGNQRCGASPCPPDLIAQPTFRCAVRWWLKAETLCQPLHSSYMDKK